MKQKAFLTFVGIIFAIIAILHLLRAILQWPAQIGTFQIPVWLSWIAVIVTALLSYIAFQLSIKNR